MHTICITPYSCPCGTLILGSFENRLCLCDWQEESHRMQIDKRLKQYVQAESVQGISPVITQAATQLDEYFAGKRRVFNIPLLFVGTEFQKKVWNALLHIPFGTTISYADLAQRIAMPTAVRAVANANRANALSVIVPCHRVLGADGSLTGYSGGIEVKRWLLEHESHLLF